MGVERVAKFMNTDPKSLYLTALEKSSLVSMSLQFREHDTINLREAEMIQRQLSDALMSMNALIRRIKQEPEPRTGDTEDGK